MPVALEGDQVCGSVMAGYEGHGGWISRIAIRQSYRGRGSGSDPLVEAERRLTALGCVKVILQVTESNLDAVAFYEKSGYAVELGISMSKLVRH